MDGCQTRITTAKKYDVAKNTVSQSFILLKKIYQINIKDKYLKQMKETVLTATYEKFESHV